ncbi:MAG TPA: 3-deoxy-7-phosphoheptulonate synthase [Verrucomicrobiae bacterium]|nr:3-deoxy-7-phosphoheptulonate synthase [Verrucomicrobiae bacterium]
MSIAGNVSLQDLPRICPLISRRVQSSALVEEQHIVRVKDVRFGDTRPVVIAGPCAVESFDQTLAIALAVRDAGAEMLRGGAFKPRTSPHDFQGLGIEGLRILHEVSRETGLPVVTEVMDTRLVQTVCEYADMLQIGSRNMQNYPLLIEAGKSGKPVLLKRGMAASLCEWLGAAEYIANEGNLNIVLCERGIKAYPSGEYSRNVLDLNVIPAVKEETFLPVIVDPSHATGVAGMVESASCAAIAYGGHGLLIEVACDYPDAAKPRCDAAQAISPATLSNIVQFIDKHIEKQEVLRKVHAV